MKHKLVTGVVAAWFAGIAIMVGVVVHTLPAAAADTATARWPSESVIAPAVGVTNVVMVADPQQPCMRARMAELARFADGARVQVHVVIVGTDPGAEQAAIESATAIRGARVFVDHDGEEARRFGGVATCRSRIYSAPNSPPPLPSVPAWWTSTDSGPKLVENVSRAAS
jgi:hypothetical protein